VIRNLYHYLRRRFVYRHGYPQDLNGLKVWVDYDWRTSFAPDYDYQTIKLLRDHAPLGTVWNVGANVGQMALQLMPLATRLVLFEPNPMAGEVLDKHIRMNVPYMCMYHLALVGVQIVPCAVGAEYREDAPMFVDGARGMGRLDLPNPELPDAWKILVDQVTLDAMMLSGRYGEPKWVVMDIEGHEIDALYGARDLLGARVNWVVELHPRPAWSWCGRTKRDLVGLLANYEYEVVPLSGQTDALEEHGVVWLKPL
jgi:FkbM family methyltransferase